MSDKETDLSNYSDSSNVTRAYESSHDIIEEPSISYETEEGELTISDSRDSICSSVNRLCLDFTRNSEDDTPSKIVKCESFWRFVDTMPDLENIRVAGKEVSEVEIGASLESTTRVDRSNHSKFPWLHMLMKFNKMKLDQTALAGCKVEPVTDPEDLILTSPTTEECATEAMAVIDQFEEDWAKRPQKTKSEAFQLIKQNPATPIKSEK